MDEHLQSQLERDACQGLTRGIQMLVNCSDLVRLVFYRQGWQIVLYSTYFSSMFSQPSNGYDLLFLPV